MAPRICGACGADLNQRPHYSWCPNAGCVRWVPIDDWLKAHDGYSSLAVDNGDGREVYAWSPPAPTSFDDVSGDHAHERGVRVS